MPEDLRCGYMISDDEGAAYRCAILVNAAGEHSGEHYFKRESAGRVAPVPPDPERDSRRAAYAASERSRERRRAARALDRFMELQTDDIDVATGERARIVAGERFVEQVGDYVMSRLQQKSHYGVSCAPNHGDKDWCEECAPDPPRMAMDGPDLPDDACLRIAERAEYCPAAGSPRCTSCVWRPAADPA